MKSRVAVIGQGYVGLPLSLAAARAGHTVIGIDKDLKKIDLLNSGVSPIEGINSNEIREALHLKKYIGTNSYEAIIGCEVICVCIPTPLDKDRKPDLGLLKQVLAELAKYLKENTLVVIESTIQPGTTRNILTKILEEGSGLNRETFFLAYSPERIDPGNTTWNIENTPKLVSGLDERSVEKAINFYGTFVNRVEVCESLEVAETAKLLENSFRLINISFVNELSIFCQELGINTLDVITAAATKPYGFMAFYPSIGVGGHCIPVDPLYLSHKADQVGLSFKLIDLADEINLTMPKYFVKLAKDKLGSLKNKNIIVVGVAYKANVSDVRETAAGALIEGLRQDGANVVWHDDLVKEWNGEKSISLSSTYDLAILATPHDYLDIKKLGSVPIINTRGTF